MIPFAVDEVLADGIAALRWAAACTRAEIGGETDAGPLWLVVRDLDGLADRLEEVEASAWRRGEASFFVTGQDVGVLADWHRPGADVSPYRGEVEDAADSDRTRALDALRAFLEWYLEHEMELMPNARRRERGA